MTSFIALLGRICYATLFIMSSFGHFTQPTIQYATSQGVPYASILVPVSGMIAFLGGASILLGYKTRFGAWLIVLFLVPVTLMIHKFWHLPEAQAVQQQVNFMKNLGLLGGALFLAAFGPGALSVDRK